MENTHSELGYLIKTTLSDKEKEGLLLELVEVVTQAVNTQWEYTISSKTESLNSYCPEPFKQKVLGISKASCAVMGFSQNDPGTTAWSGAGKW